MYKSLTFTLTLTIFSLLSLNLFAQNVVNSPASPANTVTIPPQTPASPGTSVPGPEAFPTYTVTPSEDLNPYGLSSLDSSTEKNYRNDQGTLGTNTKRTTNAEANKAIIEKKKAEREEMEKQKGTDDTGKVTSLDEQYVSESEPQTVSKEYKKTKLIRWTDENGSVHITNDIGNVPQRYLDSVEYK